MFAMKGVAVPRRGYLFGSKSVSSECLRAGMLPLKCVAFLAGYNRALITG